MRVAVYAGSFDPFTRGHGSILKSAVKSFDKVVVAIGHSKKQGLFPFLDRKQFIKDVVEKDLFLKSAEQPTVETFDGLLVNFCKDLLNRMYDGVLPDSVTIVRGLRAVSDLEYEMAIADANRRLANRFQTVFIPTEADLAFVSSSIVRELLLHKVPLGDIHHYIYPSTQSSLLHHNALR